MDLKKYAENLGLDEDDFKELTSLFIETTKSDLEKLKSALEANDFTKAREASHSIKGAAGNLGFMDIWETASESEKASENQDETLVKQSYFKILEKTEKLDGLTENG
ncbi:MAG: Hpt domain-containing protein [Thermodesulfobacteriota bacterium]